MKLLSDVWLAIEGKGKEGFVVRPETTWDEFVGVVEKYSSSGDEEGDKEVRAMGEGDMKVIFETLRENAVKNQADERRRAERRMRTRVVRWGTRHS